MSPQLPRSLRQQDPRDVPSEEELERLMTELGLPYEPRLDRLTR